MIVVLCKFYTVGDGKYGGYNKETSYGNSMIQWDAESVRLQRWSFKARG